MNDHAMRAGFLSDDPTTQLDLGKMFFLAGNWKRAESSVRDALRLDPKIAGGHYFLGLATLGQGRVAEGVALLRRVDRKDPHRKDAEAVLARITSEP
jgi:tetratricopeptide (TPR) repeat protein